MQTNVNQVNILVVDDRKENLVALESLLRDEQTKIHKANSGREALELLLAHDFALAILDVQMPEINGFELAELMRGKEKTKSIPIIFVTAGAIDPKNTFQGYESGAVDFLYKPLVPGVVLSKVRVFRELDQQKQLIKIQMEQLTTALKTREEFMSIASHELKTPITSLKLQLQLARRGLGGADDQTQKMMKVVDTSLRQVEKISRLIDELLDVSRIQAGKLRINLEEIDFSKVVMDTVSAFRPQLKSADCDLTVDVDENVMACVDAFRAEQVIINLLTNVTKYAAGTPVLVSLKTQNGKAVLTVKDGGEGVPADKLDLIFDRFERIDSPRVVNGLGLGLYIVKKIMDGHAGTIELQSELGKGATFIARFPISGGKL